MSSAAIVARAQVMSPGATVGGIVRVPQQPTPHQHCVGYEHCSSEERPCACEPRREGIMAIRRQDQCRPEPNLEDPQWHSGTPTPARSVGELEATEQMREPCQRDHETENGEQE